MKRTLVILLVLGLVVGMAVRWPKLTLARTFSGLSDDGHNHQAADILGPFGDITLTGDLRSFNWDGGSDLSSTYDAGATEGYFADSSAGAAQFMGSIYVGGSLSLIGSGAITGGGWDGGTGAPDQFLRVMASDDTRASTPDHASLDITGDVSIMVHANTPTNVSGHLWVKKADEGASSGTANYSFGPTNNGGTLVFVSSATIIKSSTAAPTLGSDRYYGVTVDADNGAAGYDIKFWQSATGAVGTWTQLGATVTTAGVLTLTANAHPLLVSDWPAYEDIYEVAVWTGIRNFDAGTGGTLVANPKFDDHTEWPDQGPNNDSLGLPWTLEGAAYIAYDFPSATEGFIWDGDYGFGQVFGPTKFETVLAGPGLVANERIRTLDTPTIVVDPATGNEVIRATTAGVVASVGGTDVLTVDSTTRMSGAWTDYTPAWTASGTAPALGNGVLIGSYQKIGRTVHVKVRFQPGSTSTFGTGDYYWSLPLTAAAIYTDNTSGGDTGVAWVHDVGTAYVVAAVQIFTTTTVIMYAGPGNTVTRTWPMTWVSGDRVHFSLTYEAAA